MLNALCIALEGMDADGWSRAVGSMARQGFVGATPMEWPGGRLHAWQHESQQDTELSEWGTTDKAACCAGTLWYRGRFGKSALSTLLRDVETGSGIDEDQLRGNFALFLRTDDQWLLLNDAMGLVRIYASRDRRFYSTSWLATCAYAGTVELHEAAAIEYVLLGASHSDQTVGEGITTLPLGKVFNLKAARVDERSAGESVSNTPEPESIEEAASRLHAHLQTQCSEIVTAFPGAVRMALSGGFDSRLILAGLLERGAHPDLFVYGSAANDDVRVARQVAETVGLPLNAVDKSAIAAEQQLPDLETLVQSALFFDGLPNDGIYDRGVDRDTRLAQTAQAHIALNGGGGEILRNYFYLPDRPLSPRDVVRSFYRGFDRAVFRRRGALSIYETRLASSIVQAVGACQSPRHARLSREQVELIYPLFRCHHWMAVNNSVSTRHGHYITPLLDAAVVRLACRLPLDWKNVGRLESLLIKRLHPDVAGPMSAHGFSFHTGPGARAAFADWTTRMRPVGLRPLISAAHRRVQKRRVSPSLIAHCRALLPGEWRLDPILKLDQLPDDSAFARALAIEVTWRELFKSQEQAPAAMRHRIPAEAVTRSSDGTTSDEPVDTPLSGR
jgi:asparagine synthase (glutamine-hydrolysing)